MKGFSHINARRIDDAVRILRQYGGKAKIIAGGTDLLGQLKNRIHPLYPESIVNIKTIPSMDHFRKNKEVLKIGALAKLRDIGTHSVINENYTALAQAANAVASTPIRTMGTIGGNLCQDIRCWYYRASKNYFYCLRKEGAPKGTICYAVKGDNRYNSIFGPVNRCFAVNPSDSAPALIALNARLKTTERVINAEDFFAADPGKTTVLADDEILTEIQILKPIHEMCSRFSKYAFRNAIDFPIVNCAVAIIHEKGVIENARICLNGVYNIPYRIKESEELLRGQKISTSIAEEAGRKAVENTIPLKGNKYMIQIAKELVKRTLLLCR